MCSLSKKHTEALHLSAWLFLYVNLVYLSSLQGNAASAYDSEMRHFSLLTKKREKQAPIQWAAEWKPWLHQRASMAMRLSFSLLGVFREPHNEKKTTAIFHGAGRASGRATVATRCSHVITLAIDEGDDPLVNENILLRVPHFFILFFFTSSP